MLIENDIFFLKYGLSGRLSRKRRLSEKRCLFKWRPFSWKTSF
jgi:hypothetical protein